MSLETWSQAGWIRPHQTSPEAIGELWLIVQRDLEDAATGRISQDWQFGIGYNAALKLCTILLHAEGYRPGRGQSGHRRAIQALPLILGAESQGDADYLDSCREKRNTAEYDQVGIVSKKDVEELLQFTRELSVRVRQWLAKEHPTLAPNT